MIHFQSLAKECRDISWTVAHLYEHLILAGFIQYLRSHNIPAGLVGYIAGETFQNVIFLNIFLYDDEAKRLSDQYFSRPFVYSEEELQQSITSIAAEDGLSIKIKDRNELNRQIELLQDRPWTSSASHPIIDTEGHKKDVSEPISTRRNHRQFRITTLKVALESDDAHELALFIRLHLLINDCIVEAIRLDPGVYVQRSDDISRKKQTMSYEIISTHSKKVASTDILRSALKSLQTLTNPDNFHYITEHFDANLGQNSRIDLPVQYYRESGIIIGNEEMAALATPERVNSIISKLMIAHKRHSQKSDTKEKD